MCENWPSRSQWVCVKVKQSNQSSRPLWFLQTTHSPRRPMTKYYSDRVTNTKITSHKSPAAPVNKYKHQGRHKYAGRDWRAHHRAHIIWPGAYNGHAPGAVARPDWRRAFRGKPTQPTYQHHQPLFRLQFPNTTKIRLHSSSAGFDTVRLSFKLRVTKSRNWDLFIGLNTAITPWKQGNTLISK